LIQKRLDQISIQFLADQPLCFPGFRANRGQHMETFESPLFRGSGTAPTGRPNGGQGAFLAETGNVIEPNVEFFLEMLGRDFREDFREFFSNSAWATGSLWGCWGRGRKTLNPS